MLGLMTFPLCDPKILKLEEDKTPPLVVVHLTWEVVLSCFGFSLKDQVHRLGVPINLLF